MGSAVIAHFIQYKLLQTEFLEHSELFQINFFGLVHTILDWVFIQNVLFCTEILVPYVSF
jgi:hypothetical protein